VQRDECGRGGVTQTGGSVGDRADSVRHG
jgi:hypothetical protein